MPVLGMQARVPACTVKEANGNLHPLCRSTCECADSLGGALLGDPEWWLAIALLMPSRLLPAWWMQPGRQPGPGHAALVDQHNEEAQIPVSSGQCDALCHTADWSTGLMCQDVHFHVCHKAGLVLTIV